MPAKSREPEITSSFVFATCREGSERALKEEVATEHGPTLRPAFMRPQLITWKSTLPLKAGFSVKSIFARVLGISLGTFKSPEELIAHAAEHLKGRSFHLHVFPREVPEDGVPDETRAHVDKLHEQLAGALKEAGVKLSTGKKPERNDLVLDVILVDENGALLLGVHRHTMHSHTAPGGLPHLVIPSEAPSRTWLKMEQALIWAGWDGPGALKGKTVLELGSSPGGASYSLLQHGARVVGVDSGEMAPVVLDYPGGTFTHLHMSAGDLADVPLPANIKIIVSDMNIAPPQMLRHLERIQARVRAPAMLLTMKINNPSMERNMDRFIRVLRRFAPAPIRATQLPANRAEICVMAGKI
jgi:23S rRNA (cytidine2498-2'-O)-methyltransferase